LDSKILIAEDMTSVREVLIETFNAIGYNHIVGCKDGADAWEKIQNESPPFQLIVSDLNMPDSNGMDLLIRIRTSDRYKNLPFLMISEMSDQSHIMNAMKSGADYYLVKPIKAPELASKLKIIHQKRNEAKTS